MSTQIKDTKNESEQEQVENSASNSTQAIPTEEPLLSHFDDLPRGAFIKKFWRLFLIGMSVNFSAIYSGYTLSAPGNIVANQGFIDQFGTIRDATTGALSLNATYVSLWGAIVFAAQVVSQLLSPLVADRFGLKANMYLFTIFMVLAIVLEIIAKDWKVFLGGKILSGISSGFLPTTILAYTSEVTQKQIRGIQLASFSFFNALGQFLVAIGLQVLQSTAPLEYRRIFYSEFAVLGLWLPVCILLPESPVFLCKKHRYDQAKRSLRRLVGNVEGYDLEHEFSVLKYQVEESLALTDKSSKTSWIAALKGTNLRRTIISTIPYNFQIFVGAPLVFGYTTYFFQLAGLENAFLANVIVYCVLLVGILVSFYAVDRVGRRPLLLGGGTALCIACFIIGALGSVGTSNGSSTANGLIAVSCIWVFFYSVSVAPLGYSSLVEISTPQLRSVTAGLASGFYACINTAFYYLVPALLSEQQIGLGIKSGYVFGGLSAAGLIVIWLMFPETKNRSYPELDELFDRRIPAWRFNSTKTSAQVTREGKDGVETI